MFQRPINVINTYGDVESRTPVSIIDEKWEELMKEISKIEARDEAIIWIGDMNKHFHMNINSNDTIEIKTKKIMVGS